MAEQQATLTVSKRTETGTSPVRRLRQEGKIPGVIYAEGEAATALTLDAHAFAMELRKHSSENVLIQVDVDGEGDKQVLVKDVQHHPLTGAILHVDLQAVSMTETLQVEVAIELVGDPVGVVQFGGTLEQLLGEAEVECLPANIPSSLEFDVSELMIGDSVVLGSLKLDEAKVTLVSDPELAVAHVSPPRVAEVADEEAEEEAGPEVITEKSEDDEA